jgi:hypothetical protein
MGLTVADVAELRGLLGTSSSWQSGDRAGFYVRYYEMTKTLNSSGARIKKLYSAMKIDMKVPDTTVQALGKSFVIDIEGVAIAVAFVPAPPEPCK